MDEETSHIYQEKIHGEAIVSDLLRKELTQLDLSDCGSPEYSTSLRLNPEGENEKMNGILHNSPNKMPYHIKSESTEAYSGGKSGNGSQTETGSRRVTGSNMRNVNKLLTDRDAVDIIETVEQDAEILSRKLKLFNRKHKPLPSIRSLASSKR